MKTALRPRGSRRFGTNVRFTPRPPHCCVNTAAARATATAIKQTNKDDIMKKLLSFLLSRAYERSTWLGIVSIATALGLTMTELQSEAVIAVGMSIAGVIAAFTGDTKAEDTQADNKTDEQP